MNKLLTLGAAALLVTAMGLPALAEMPPAPDGPIKMELTKKPVMFDHAVHAPQQCEGCHVSTPQHFPPMAVDQQKMCVVCHHLVDGDFAPSFTCSDCHNEMDRSDKSELSYFRIAHARSFDTPERSSCLSCHFDVIKTRPEKRQALTSCVGSACHPKD